MQLLPVLYRQEAGADLDNIFIYLVEQGAGSSTARGFVGRIKARCQDIGVSPRAFRCGLISAPVSVSRNLNVRL